MIRSGFRGGVFFSLLFGGSDRQRTVLFFRSRGHGNQMTLEFGRMELAIDPGLIA
jgi:hypothetical protein